MKVTYYEIKNERYKDVNPLPILMVQIGDYFAGARFIYDESAWIRDDDLFYRWVWDGDPDDYREVSEAGRRGGSSSPWAAFSRRIRKAAQKGSPAP